MGRESSVSSPQMANILLTDIIGTGMAVGAMGVSSGQVEMTISSVKGDVNGCQEARDNRAGLTTLK